jgi:hypothetical protein
VGVIEFIHCWQSIFFQSPDEMFDSAFQFNNAMMCATPNIPVPFRLVFMAILFGHYKELKIILKETEDPEPIAP